MKKVFLFALTGTIYFSNVNAQTPYTSAVDGSNVTVLNGIVTKYALENSKAFGWYATNQSTYKTDMSVINAMEAAKNKVQFIVFGGTWCEDTQNILPKFFKIQEQSGFPDNNISLFAMDRTKKTLGNIGDAFKITNVPTIIVMKDGKEAGRVVEYGKTGKWDAEIAEILRKQ